MSWEKPNTYTNYIFSDELLKERKDVKSITASDGSINLFYSPHENISFNSIAFSFTCVLGMTGTGKTNTCAKILEEILKYEMPIIVFDLEGDYISLKEISNTINIILHPQPEKITEYIKMIYEEKKSLIFDFSDSLNKDDIISFVFPFSVALWEQAMKNTITKDIYILYDEAHEFAPQSYNPMDAGISELKQLRGLIVQMCKRGRKKGVHGMFATQRPQALLKDVIAQTNNRILHRVVDDNDVERYRTALPRVRKQIIYDAIRKLKNGACFFVQAGSNNIFKAQVLKRKTYHKGKTSQLNDLRAWKVETWKTQQ